MLTFLKSTVDDAPADQRAGISAVCVFLLAATAPVRHGAGADHIASFDSVVRKPMAPRKRPACLRTAR